MWNEERHLETNVISCTDLSAVASSPEDSAAGRYICHLQVGQQNI